MSGIQGLGMRQYLTETIEGFGAPPRTAVCVADGLIARVGANRLAELEAAMMEDPDDPEALKIQALSAELAANCPE